jgi:hypothetical protein
MPEQTQQRPTINDVVMGIIDGVNVLKNELIAEKQAHAETKKTLAELQGAKKE